MGPLFTIAKKDLLLLWRDKAGLFWVIGFPLLLALFFGSIFSGQGGDRGAMSVAFVDEDQSDFSRQFADELRKSKALKLPEIALDSARQRVRQGKLTAFLTVKKGFGDSFGFSSGAGESLELGIDPSRQAEAAYLQGLVMQAFFQVMQRQFADREKSRSKISRMLAEIDKDTSLPREQREGLTKRLSGLDFFLGSSDSSLLPGELSIMSGPEIKAVDVVSDQVHPHSAYEITFPSSILWGLIGCCASFAISIVVERTRGTLLRLRLAPISRAQILAGKGLACFIASVTVSLLLLLFGALVFKVRLTNIPGLIAAIVAASLCFVGLMMLISVLGRTEQAVSGSGWAILLVMGMTGGTMIPLWIMPKWMQTISHFSPVKWGILSLEGAIWRGFTLAEMLPPIAILLGVGLLSFAVGATIMSRSRM